MRIGLISDLHLQNWNSFGYCSDNKISKRLLKQKEVFEQAADIFKKEAVDFIIFGGDWTHSVGTISNEVLNISKDLLNNLSLPILFASGNHDTPVRYLPKDHHILTNILYDFKRDVNIDKELIKRVKLVNFYDDISNISDIKDYDLVVVHKTPVGSVVGKHIFNEGVNWRKLAHQNKFVAFGHIHQMQKLSENCFVIGSPMHLGFGDEGKRGIWIVDTDVNRCSFYKLDYPEFIVVNTSNEVKEDDNYYKVLNSSSRVTGDNVISVVLPEVFEERIKSNSFIEILKEWLTINEKDNSYLDVVKDILEEKLTLVKQFYSGKISKVVIKDFLSVGEVEYIIPENGFTLITGDSGTFNSNGSGKSSLTGEAICWALFGETTKGLTGDDVIRRGQDDCSVKLILNKGNNKIIIERSRKDGLKITVDVIETSAFPRVDRKDNIIVDTVLSGMRQTDRQEYLEESILGFDKTVFLASVYFSQENLLMLTHLSDTEKTNMITNLLGFEQYDSLQEQVISKIHSLEKEIELKNKERIDIDKSLVGLKTTVLGNEERIKDKNKQISDHEQSIQMYTEKVNEYTNRLNEKIDFIKVDYLTEIQNLRDTQDKIDNKLVTIREMKEGLVGDISSINSKISSCRMECSVNEKEVIKLENEIKSLQSLEKNVKCDKCGSFITEENIEKFVNEKSGIISQLSASLVVIEKDLMEFQKTLSQLSKEHSVLISKEKSLTEERLGTRLNLVTLEQLQRDQETREKDYLVSAEKIRGEIDKYSSFIKDSKKKIGGLNEQLKDIYTDKDKLLDKIKMLDDSILSTNESIRKIEDIISKLGFWKIAFSSKGIRSVLLDRFCNEINVFVNQYLSTVSSGLMTLVVTPTKVTKGGEERNKIGMSIQIDGQEVKYESLSGGEKRRVDISLIFGLNKWISSKHNIDNGIFGLIILDEVFSFLDSTGSETTAQLLWDEGKNRNIFVIDHALGLSSYADRIWTVNKVNGVSKLLL